MSKDHSALQSRKTIAAWWPRFFLTGPLLAVKPTPSQTTKDIPGTSNPQVKEKPLEPERLATMKPRSYRIVTEDRSARDPLPGMIITGTFGSVAGQVY